jgi:hypothetical protein
MSMRKTLSPALWDKQSKTGIRPFLTKAAQADAGTLRLSLFDRRHELSLRWKALQKAIFLSAFLVPNKPHPI